MFVARLNGRQQGLLLTLSKQLIAVDGNVQEKETTLLATLQAQMSPGIEAAEVSQLGEDFPTQESKAALLLELLGLAHADEEYHLDEQDFITQIARQIGVGKDLLTEMEDWVMRQFALVREAEEFMES